MDDIFDMLDVYVEFNLDPTAMAQEIVRLRRELVDVTTKLLSHEVTQPFAPLGLEKLFEPKSLGDQAHRPTDRQADCRIPADQEPGHQVTE